MTGAEIAGDALVIKRRAALAEAAAGAAWAEMLDALLFRRMRLLGEIAIETDRLIAVCQTTVGFPKVVFDIAMVRFRSALVEADALREERAQRLFWVLAHYGVQATFLAHLNPDEPRMMLAPFIWAALDRLIAAERREVDAMAPWLLPASPVPTQRRN